MSAPRRLKAAANSARYPTLPDSRLGRRAFLVGAGAVAAATMSCGVIEELIHPHELSGGAPFEPHPDASSVGAPDAGLPNDLAGEPPAEPPDTGAKPPGTP